MCGVLYAKAGMTRHLPKCIEQKTDQSKGQPMFLIAAYSGPYWVFFEAPVTTTLKKIDGFLRDLWLECCGHLSQFSIEGERYDVSPDDEFGPKPKSMNFKLKDLLAPGMAFEHEYDFGTTTELDLRVLREYRAAPHKKETIRVLAQNDPPEIKCVQCGKALAKHICVECAWQGKGWLCDSCVEKHECDENMRLPVVNSPRVGQCGYTG